MSHVAATMTINLSSTLSKSFRTMEYKYNSDLCSNPPNPISDTESTGQKKKEGFSCT